MYIIRSCQILVLHNDYIFKTAELGLIKKQRRINGDATPQTVKTTSYQRRCDVANR